MKNPKSLHTSKSTDPSSFWTRWVRWRNELSDDLKSSCAIPWNLKEVRAGSEKKKFILGAERQEKFSS